MTTIDELIESLPAKRRAKVRQRVIALIEQHRQEAEPSGENIISMKRTLEERRNGKRL